MQYSKILIFFFELYRILKCVNIREVTVFFNILFVKDFYKNFILI